MTILNLINSIDPDKLERDARDKFLNRKDALSKMGNWGKKLALAAVPLGAISAFATPAKAQSTSELAAVLNFALTLEYLEAEYYQTGLDSGVIASSDQPLFQEINIHEQAHVAFLIEVIGNVLGEEPVDRDTLNFDFTADGAFDPFNNYQTFLTLSQAFEDTGVRAYKGQAGAVQGSDLVLTRALQIHSVEARHAARVRQLRGLNGWITGGPEGEMVPPAAEAVYEGEGNTKQVVEVSSTLSGDGDVDTGDITEAWDEPLTEDEVRAIAALFIDA